MQNYMVYIINKQNLSKENFFILYGILHQFDEILKSKMQTFLAGKFSKKIRLILLAFGEFVGIYAKISKFWD